MDIVFFIFLFLAVYSYLIFPGILTILPLVYQRPWRQGSEDFPAVSLIISVYNEEAVIADKLRNALELNYPKARLEILVASDGSNDLTNEIVTKISDDRVKLYAFEQRIGKTACLNKVMPLATGDIIVFTDANSMFPADALIKLVRNFADDEVGSVTGWTKYVSSKGDKDVTGQYARLEKWLKIQESRVSSCVGADGAIFSVRKKNYRNLDDRDINDFIIPLDIVSQGMRVVLDPELFCHEMASDSAGKAFRRQVRITSRTLSAIFRRFHFLNLFRYGIFSFFLLSHKVIRLLTPFFFLSAIFINIFMLNDHVFFRATFSVICLFILIGFSGILFGLDGKLTSLGRRDRLAFF